MSDPLIAKLYNLIFYPFEVVFRYREPQLQMDKKYLNLQNLNTNTC